MWTEAEAFYVHIVAKPKNTPEFKGEGDRKPGADFSGTWQQRNKPES